MGEGFRLRSAKASRTLPHMTPHSNSVLPAGKAATGIAPALTAVTASPHSDGRLWTHASARMGRAMTGPPRSPSTPPDGDASDAPGEQDGLDLGELLASRGLKHWKPMIDDLIDRYSGWLTDYWLDDQFDLDLWPAADVIKALVAMPVAQRGDDLAFARALAECDFLVRLARDLKTGQSWDALSQPYREFAEAGEVEPYWGLQPPWPPAAFTYWAMARLKAGKR
jgi:hypothetical protein